MTSYARNTSNDGNTPRLKVIDIWAYFQKN
ncbi:MAG: hypothetical protein H6Q20_838 [Bacteroidetes bacterium]|nr:hypothetical protein [Bacteroidota bacterium]